MNNNYYMRAAVIMAQGFSGLISYYVHHEPLESVKEQLKPKLINSELTFYFLDQIIPQMNEIQKHIVSRLEKR